MPRATPIGLLRISVFISGFSVMGIELLASRLIAPGLGSSVLIWTNVIGVILLSLACGAWIGGSLADRWPKLELVGACLAGGGVLSLGLFFLTAFSVLPVFFNHDALAAPILALLFLAPPTLVLGAVSPAAVKLALHGTDRAGHIAGQLSALNTLGSLLGTYLTGYVLMARWPTTAIIQLVSGVLLLNGLLLLRRKPATTVMLAGVCGIALGIGSTLAGLPGAWIPSHYSAMRIVPAMFHRTQSQLLWMNNDAHAGSTMMSPTTSVFAYDRAFIHLADRLFPQAASLLQIGGGGFHAPREWLSAHANGQATVIERDPAAVQAARLAFGLKNDPRLHIIENDGRRAVAGLSSRFDLIFMDAYADRLTIPWHLVTAQAFDQWAAHLNPNGLIVMNVILNRDPQQAGSQALVASIVNAAKPHFSWSRLVLADDKTFPPGALVNTLLIIGNGRPPDDQLLTQPFPEDPWVTTAMYPINPNTHPALSDAYAPVEWMSTELN